ncbi:amylo-alpha-1,6-glucosidase [Vallitalea okinawensis]|uniref:amylo-alpha-1,6-glucosidase n=1 Tax=Vallitalea okinawensis TaxID=2078660 RepID=UPI0013004144|nr:trehalase family glycosidase [Vallitalea okinawensis]
MNLPNIWGPGSLFAFSGLEGENTYKNSLVGTLSADGIGVTFHTKTRRQLRFGLKNIRDIHYELVASDMIKAQLQEKITKVEKELVLAFYSQDTVVGITTPAAAPYIFADGDVQLEYQDDMTVISIDEEYTVLVKDQSNDCIKYAFSYSNQSKEDAIEKAKSALLVEVDGVVADKLSFFYQLPNFEVLDESIERAVYKCYSVMKTQVYTPEGIFKTRHTTPDRLPHKKVWLWDSVFHSIGNKFISKELAYDSIKAVLDMQKEDGFIPHMATPYDHSDITQPPIIAYGIFELYQFTDKKNILEETYDQLKKYLHWNMEKRDSNKNNLFEWLIENDDKCRCGESGMDNSPRFDDVTLMECIDFSCFMAKEANTMAKIAGVLGLEDDQQYWTELFNSIKEAVNKHLWDEEDHFYYDKIIADGQFKKVKAVSSFLPLFAGVCEPPHAEWLVKHLEDVNEFNTTFPIPSISLDDPTFGTDMWRGPVWINYNYMIIKGLKDYGYNKLADEILKKTIEIMTQWYLHDGVIYEFYDSTNTVSPCQLYRKGPAIEPYDFRIRYQSIRDYGWSCTLFPVMVMEYALMR